MTHKATPAELIRSQQMDGEVIELGTRLRRAREAIKLTQQDVAQRLHLKLQTVIALEQDDYEKIPAPTFAKGYLRLYAMVVGLSPEDIIESYNRLGHTELSVVKMLPKKKAEPYIAGKILRWLIISVTLGMLVLAGRWIYIENLLHYNGIGPVLNWTRSYTS